MACLSNKTVNYLNVHLALVSLLDQSYLVFSPIYLYRQGFSITQVFTLYATLNVLRLPLRLLSFPIIRRWGLKVTVMIGTAGYGLSFPVLGHVHGWSGWLLLYAVLFSLFNAMHWFAFHTFYSLAGEHEKRGRQVAIGQALGAGLAALSPVLSAFVIADAGFQQYFILAFALIILMLFTLSRCKDIAIPHAGWNEGKKAVFSLGPRIHLMESSIVYPLTICWLFVVYLYVGEIVSLGGIVAFGVLAQALYQLLLGAWVDKGRGAYIASVSASLRALVAIGRSLLPLSLPVILFVEATNAAASVHNNAIEPTVLYNAGKQSPHPIWYWLFTETAWDIGTLIGAGGAAFLLWQGVELRHVILMALPFIGILWWLLYNYCIKNPYVRPSV